MWTLYILQSRTTGRFYTGHTNDLPRRLAEHESGQTQSTRNRGPWTLVHSEEFPTKEEAYARERQIKNWKSHKAIELLIAKR